MRRVLPAVVTLFTFLLCVSLIAAAGEGKDKAKTKKKSVFEGTWSSAKDAKYATLTFAGDKFTVTKTSGDKTESFTGTFKLDETKTPNTIDMTVTGGTSNAVEKFKGKTSLGIVKVDGDKLEWCASEPGKDVRPKVFAAVDGDAKFLYQAFERAKK